MRPDALRHVLILLLSCVGAMGQQARTFTWSSNCANCESTIFAPGWYSNGSGIFAEGISGDTIGAMAGVSAIDRYFVVGLGFAALKDKGSISLNPSTAVTIETDSSPHMVLYSIEHPDTRIIKGSAAEKKLLKNKTVSVSAGPVTAGYLLFPTDTAASRITVVVVAGDETFRFPFTRNPNARAKFQDPDTLPSSKLGKDKVASDSTEGREQVAVSEIQGKDPVWKWCAQQGGYYNGSRCFFDPDGNKEIPLPPELSSRSTSQEPPAMPPSSKQTAQLGQDAVPTSIVAPDDEATCDKNISFAVASGGDIVAQVPAFARKWLAKNQGKYRELCFNQTPKARTANFLFILSTSRSAFNGMYPTVRTSATTSTTPVSGSGTVRDTYGGMWNYTYDGTITTTETTTTHENVPYTDTANTLYLYSYDERGRLVSKRWRTITTRQGGARANTLGYNLGAAIGAIHLKERLLKDAVEDVAKAPR